MKLQQLPIHLLNNILKLFLSLIQQTKDINWGGGETGFQITAVINTNEVENCQKNKIHIIITCNLFIKISHQSKHHLQNIMLVLPRNTCTHASEPSLLQLGCFIQISSKQFCPFNVVSNINFLILRMSTIIPSAYRQQDYTLSSHFLKSKGDRN